MTGDASEHDDQSRAERVRIAVLATDPAELSQALRRMPKHLSEAIAKQIGVPAPVLRRDPAPARFLRRTAAPPVFSTVADVLISDCLAAMIEVLGSAADDPTLNQLRAAVDAVAEEHPHPMIALTLATTAASGAPATEACEQILADDERFALPTELPDEQSGADAPAPSKAPAPSGPTPEERAAREARKARKAERKAKERERQQKAREAAERERRARRQKGGAPTDSAPPSQTSNQAPAGPARRAPVLSPAETADFDVNDPLVGSVVIAQVDFDGDDLDHPELTGKRRPVVVVGVAADELLVRPGYSDGGVTARSWQSVEVQDRLEAGLRGRSWIERDTRRIFRIDASAPVGRLSTRDWNALW